MVAAKPNTLRRKFLVSVEKFLDKSEISATRFGYLSCGDPGFVRKLRDGRDFRASTFEKVTAYMVRRGKVKTHTY